MREKHGTDMTGCSGGKQQQNLSGGYDSEFGGTITPCHSLPWKKSMLPGILRLVCVKKSNFPNASGLRTTEVPTYQHGNIQ